MGWTSAALRHRCLNRFHSNSKQTPISLLLQSYPSDLPAKQKNRRHCSTSGDTPVIETKPRAFLNGSSKRRYGIGRGGVHRAESNDVLFQAARIAHVVERDCEGVERELNSNVCQNPPSSQLIGEVIRALSARGASALRFFRWVQSAHRGCLLPSSDIYNRLVDNAGRTGDYGSMLLVLQEMSSLNYDLNDEAFDFLRVLNPDDAKFAVLRMVEVLNEVGGECRGFGIHSLIQFICNMKAFDVAVSVVHKVARKVSFYNAIIAAKCRHGDFKGAVGLLEIMRESGCAPTTTSYNYILGGLFKNKRISEGCELLQTMKGLGYIPDEVTYEIIIFQACSVKKLDYAMEMLHLMLSNGLKPRLTTHAILIKGYFQIEGMMKAHKYVVDMSYKDRYSTNTNYSLLANLFLMSGRVVQAGGILSEMMEKGLKPNFPVYVKTLRNLHSLGMRDHAVGLVHKFFAFQSSTHINK